MHPKRKNLLVDKVIGTMTHVTFDENNRILKLNLKLKSFLLY